MSYLQAANVALSAQFSEFAGGPGVNLDDVTVTITKVGDVTPTLGPLSEGIGNPANGVYTYVWSTSLDTEPGDYTVLWEGTDADLETVQASEVVTIQAAVTGTWCSLAEVEAITGQAVTAGQLAAASSVITLYANRNPTAIEGLRARDLYWLKQACAWQARWQAQQPGYDQNSVVSGTNQDTVQVSYESEWNITLAPLAARALKNLSWKGSRTIRIHTDGALPVRDFTNEASDPYTRWFPLDGV